MQVPAVVDGAATRVNKPPVKFLNKKIKDGDLKNCSRLPLAAQSRFASSEFVLGKERECS